VEMVPGFLAPGIDGVNIAFLTKYFTIFDTTRKNLIDVYSPTATYSLSINTTIPPRARIKGYHHTMPNQRSLSWTPWLAAGSRNLKRVSKLDKTTTSLHSLAEDIVKVIVKLPKTKHGLEEGEKFVVDAYTAPQVMPGQGNEGIVLFATVHGEFAEVPSNGIRSFDRTFVLAPVREGSRAHAAGWPVEILSDQLVVRGYSSHETWTPGPLKIQGVDLAIPGPPPSQIVVTSAAMMPVASQPQPIDSVLAAFGEPQRSLIVQCMTKTGLNSDFAKMCLEANGWDIEGAFANFQELRASIPADAFLK